MGIFKRKPPVYSDIESGDPHLLSIEDEIRESFNRVKQSSHEDFAPRDIREATAALPLPEYVRHNNSVDTIGKLSAQAVVAQYEAAARAIEAMGAELIDCARRAEAMAAGVRDVIAYVQDTAQQYREEAKSIFERIEQASMLTTHVRQTCDEMRRRIERPEEMPIGVTGPIGVSCPGAIGIPGPTGRPSEEDIEIESIK